MSPLPLEETGDVVADGVSADDADGSGTSRYPPVFFHLLANTLLVSVINFTVWFAVTFWVFLETRSVFATGIIAGLFLALLAASGIWFGSLVDHHRKKSVMIASTLGSLAMYAVCLAIYVPTDKGTFKDPTSVTLWIFVVLLMIGVIIGNLRGIAMSTVVTLLIPEDRRDRANGLVGTTSGVSFLVTSVISGVLVGLAGMLLALLVAIVALTLAAIHLMFVRVEEDRETHASDAPHAVDLRGTIRLVRGVPGLFAMIMFSTINNFLGGVFMALVDAYGLSLISVQAWGLLWGVLSTGFIVGGLVVAKRGLGANPLRALLLGNIVAWIATSVYALQSSIILFAIGSYVWMCVIPLIEAGEQTVLQKVVPYERQGRVFGFAQSVEQSASPLTAFLISPIAQFVFIPFMTTGAGVELIGGWFGTGPERGIALLLTVSGLIGLAFTIYALRSRFYRLLSRRYAEAPDPQPAAA